MYNLSHVPSFMYSDNSLGKPSPIRFTSLPDSLSALAAELKPIVVGTIIVLIASLDVYKRQPQWEPKASP